jgi:hypothetical protein
MKIHSGQLGLIAGGLISLLLLASCGGGSSMSSMPSSTPAAPTQGAAMVSITDDPGDFLSYLVNVTSLQLTRSDGTVVETVSTATQVDFAQLVNLSEVISAQQVPAGKYVSASITLDYGTGTAADPNASIVVDNGAGGVTVPAANIFNGTTALVAPNNQITVTLKLPSGKPLVITPGTVANLALDFDLAASNTVAPAAPTASTPASGVTVTVNPVLTASLVPDTTKQIRVRGPLVSVDNMGSDSSYMVKVRPFYNKDGTEGQVEVNTTATTNFTINGAASVGSAGLTALAALPAGTLTAAYGAYDVAAKTFTAATVYAGTSIPGAGLDSVEGTIIARNGDVLTLSHGIGCGRDGDGEEAWFSRQIAVTVGASTMVTEDGQSGSFGPQDISVGQHALLFGTYGTDSAGNKTLDATAGSARLMVTPLWGKYTSMAAGVVTLALQSLDGNAASAFDFTGTGSSSAQDATAGAYSVSVPSSLQVPPTNAGSPIRFFGFVAPFGMAPPDFSATTLVSYANTVGQLQVIWAPPGLTAPFESPLSATNVVISQATLQSAWFQSVRIGPQRLKPSAVSTGLTLVPNAAASMTQFSVGHAKSHKIDSYSDFGDLISALNTDLNGMTAMLGVFARGPYDSSSGTLSVSSVFFLLND